MRIECFVGLITTKVVVVVVSSGCLAEQPQTPEIGPGLNRIYPQDLNGAYVVLLTSVIICCAVFCNMFHYVG